MELWTLDSGTPGLAAAVLYEPTTTQPVRANSALQATFKRKEKKKFFFLRTSYQIHSSSPRSPPSKIVPVSKRIARGFWTLNQLDSATSFFHHLRSLRF
ncbi:hypothetical protein I7I53_09740 [Histoplasma capsulatum var. duboisii H88]|uniref:Uncharacterized protein n=1 Tax=Ajellomyces capsulatus (strain H88) TaxID=544711 RepID=A0A8A1LAD0_AJEC8|nr:hypothetical protein I7I53_09740 [Histoplasma capsulatum var. duboisii H88]